MVKKVVEVRNLLIKNNLPGTIEEWRFPHPKFRSEKFSDFNLAYPGYVLFSKGYNCITQAGNFTSEGLVTLILQDGRRVYLDRNGMLITEYLNKLGRDGWELVNTENNEIFYLKRLIE